MSQIMSRLKVTHLDKSFVVCNQNFLILARIKFADGPAIKGIEIGKTAILSIEKSSDKFVVIFFLFTLFSNTIS